MFEVYNLDVLPNDTILQVHNSIIEDRYPPHVGALEFYVRLSELEIKIRELMKSRNVPVFDAVYGIKRSGWILGACLSNRLELPLFTKTEIKCIPPKFKHILIVDTVSWTGRSLRRAFSHLQDANKSAMHAAVLFVYQKCNIGSDLKIIAGDNCIHVPVFFYHKDFELRFSHDLDYADRATEIQQRILISKRIS